MSEKVRVRLLLARFYGDSEPVIVNAIDQTIWDHWDDDDEAEWVKQGQRLWGMDPTDCEWQQAWAEFAPGDLVEAFRTPVVEAAAVPVEETPETYAGRSLRGAGETPEKETE